MKTIVSLTAEQTAKWLGGKEPVDWMEHQTDPESVRAYHAHQQRMSKATYAAVDRFAVALAPDSDQAKARLLELAEKAQNGDHRAGELLVVMMATLMRTGLKLGAL